MPPDQLIIMQMFVQGKRSPSKVALYSLACSMTYAPIHNDISTK